MTTKWTFTSRAPIDWSYIFFTKDFDNEVDAQNYFNEAREHAVENGGAGSLEHDNQIVNKFNYFSSND